MKWDSALFDKITGTVGKGGLTFKVWKGKRIIEKKPIPTQVRNHLQLYQRSLYKAALAKWKTLTQEEKEQWKAEAERVNLSGHNLFISQYIKDFGKPVSAWLFTEGSGNILADYYSLNNGIIYGATWTKIGNWPVLSFDGVNDYVLVPNSDSLKFTQPITVMLLLAITGNGGSGSWPGVLRHNPHFNIYLNRQTNPDHPPLEPLARDAAKNDIWFWRYYDWVEGKFFHVALTYDGSKSYMYVNGKLFGSITRSTTMQLPTEGLRIGYNSTYFSGRVAEVRIYNIALSVGEIAAIYEVYKKSSLLN